MTPETTLMALFAVATVVGVVARRLAVPYTVSLLVAGVALGALHAIPAPHLTKELLYDVFLPGLVFEAAFHLELAGFRRNARTLLGLALPGVLVGVALTAALLVPLVHALGLGQGFGVAGALAFAAVVSATDPIAVVALFRTMGAPKRLVLLVEGESLLNDGTAAVFYAIVVTFATGGVTSPFDAVLAFARMLGLGVATGAAVAWAASLLIRRIEDAMIELTVTTLVAYGSFVLAERLGSSGIIATLSAGLLFGSFAPRAMSEATRQTISSFWEYVAFALNTLVFLLMGFEVRLSALLSAWKPAIVAWVVVTLARAALIELARFLLRRTRERFPRRWTPVLVWGGLRGALSMVLVLALPRDFPHRELIVSMAFGVVVLSIVVQGTTMSALVRRLGLSGAAGPAD